MNRLQKSHGGILAAENLNFITIIMDEVGETG